MRATLDAAVGVGCFSGVVLAIAAVGFFLGRKETEWRMLAHASFLCKAEIRDAIHVR